MANTRSVLNAEQCLGWTFSKGISRGGLAEYNHDCLITEVVQGIDLIKQRIVGYGLNAARTSAEIVRAADVLFEKLGGKIWLGRHHPMKPAWVANAGPTVCAGLYKTDLCFHDPIDHEKLKILFHNMIAAKCRAFRQNRRQKARPLRSSVMVVPRPIFGTPDAYEDDEQEDDDGDHVDDYKLDDGEISESHDQHSRTTQAGAIDIGDTAAPAQRSSPARTVSSTRPITSRPSSAPLPSSTVLLAVTSTESLPRPWRPAPLASPPLRSEQEVQHHPHPQIRPSRLATPPLDYVERPERRQGWNARLSPGDEQRLQQLSQLPTDPRLIETRDAVLNLLQRIFLVVRHPQLADVLVVNLARCVSRDALFNRIDQLATRHQHRDLDEEHSEAYEMTFAADAESESPKELQAVVLKRAVFRDSFPTFLQYLRQIDNGTDTYNLTAQVKTRHVTQSQVGNNGR